MQQYIFLDKSIVQKLFNFEVVFPYSILKTQILIFPTIFSMSFDVI